MMDSEFKKYENQVQFIQAGDNFFPADFVGISKEIVSSTFPTTKNLIITNDYEALKNADFSSILERLKRTKTMNPLSQKILQQEMELGHVLALFNGDPKTPIGMIRAKSHGEYLLGDTTINLFERKTLIKDPSPEIGGKHKYVGEMMIEALIQAIQQNTGNNTVQYAINRSENKTENKGAEHHKRNNSKGNRTPISFENMKKVDQRLYDMFMKEQKTHNKLLKNANYFIIDQTIAKHLTNQILMKQQQTQKQLIEVMEMGGILGEINARKNM